MPKYRKDTRIALRRRKEKFSRARQRRIATREKKAKKGKREILYVSWERGDTMVDFERQCSLGEEIGSILLRSFGECKYPNHTCRLFSDGKPTICRSMEGGSGMGITESYLRYFLPVGPTLYQTRKSLLKIGSDCDDIRITLGDTVGRGYFPAKMI
jgi:hypothetical protein